MLSGFVAEDRRWRTEDWGAACAGINFDGNCGPILGDYKKQPYAANENAPVAQLGCGDCENKRSVKGTAG